MDIILTFYFIIAVFHGFYACERQKDRYPNSTIWKYILVYLLNSIGWIICLPLSLILGSFWPVKK